MAKGIVKVFETLVVSVTNPIKELEVDVERNVKFVDGILKVK
jgi:hypothetical protein